MDLIEYFNADKLWNLLCHAALFLSLSWIGKQFWWITYIRIWNISLKSIFLFCTIPIQKYQRNKSIKHVNDTRNGWDIKSDNYIQWTMMVMMKKTKKKKMMYSRNGESKASMVGIHFDRNQCNWNQHWRWLAE